MELIISRSGADLMVTHSWRCVPAKKDLESMSAVGYTFKLDGKRIKLRELCALKEANKQGECYA